MDFKSLCEPGGALRDPQELKNGTWADFKSLHEPGGALRGPKNLKNGTWLGKDSLIDYFAYSAGRATVSRDAPTTQICYICSPTPQNTQKPTPTKEAVLVFVYFGLLGYISALLVHLLTLLPHQLSRQIVYLRA